MREIKFRGKRVDNGKWVYGYYWAEEHRNQNAHHIYTKETKGETDLIRITGNFIVIKKTVGQFTGLKDKNGVEIYEGDIVHCWGGESCQGYHEYDMDITVDDEYQLRVFEIQEFDEYYIIGNIHEQEA